MLMIDCCYGEIYYTDAILCRYYSACVIYIYIIITFIPSLRGENTNHVLVSVMIIQLTRGSSPVKLIAMFIRRDSQCINLVSYCPTLGWLRSRWYRLCKPGLLLLCISLHYLDSKLLQCKVIK